MIEFDAKPAVDAFKLALGKADHYIPDHQVFRVSGLQLDQLGTGSIQSSLVKSRLFRITAAADQLVNSFHLRQRVRLEFLRIQNRFPPNEEHSELGAPIAEMVIGNDPIAEEPQNLCQRVPEDGGTDMTHVHGLGYVW